MIIPNTNYGTTCIKIKPELQIVCADLVYIFSTDAYSNRVMIIEQVQWIRHAVDDNRVLISKSDPNFCDLPRCGKPIGQESIRSICKIKKIINPGMNIQCIPEGTMTGMVFTLVVVVTIFILVICAVMIFIIMILIGATVRHNLHSHALNVDKDSIEVYGVVGKSY